jgi:pimeloyl-ACP methyl ester carboxylesterase
MRVPLERHRIEIDGIGVAWLGTSPGEARSGDPVAVLHGLGSSSREFEYLAQVPGIARRPVILVDFPGFGDSDKPDGWSYAMEDQADLVATLLRQVAASRVTLVGHSMGGSIAIALAHRHPELVERLVVAEPNLDPATGSLSGHIARQPEAAFVARGYQRLLYQTRREAARGDLVAQRFLVTLEQASPVAIHRSAASLRADRSPTFREQLESLPIPRTLVWGVRTPPLDPLLADPAIAVEAIPDAGHVMMTEQPDAFAAAIARALGDANRT